MFTFNRVVILLGLFAITACGGGGGGGGDTYTAPVVPTNNAPSITNSSTNYSVVENQMSAFSITATDADGDSLTYSVGGTDGSLFSVSTSGVVTFKQS